MLKIKDSVDLVELYKHGFNKVSSGSYEFDNYIKVIKSDGITTTYDIYDDNREIEIRSNYECTHLETLFDLIEADLVEKVERV